MTLNVAIELAMMILLLLFEDTISKNVVMCMLIVFVYLSDDLRELREEYLSADPDKRKQMERRYGRKSIQQVVEESFTQDWLQEYSKKCPKCSTHIQVI